MLSVDEFQQRNANDTVRFAGAVASRTAFEQLRSPWLKEQARATAFFFRRDTSVLLENQQISALNISWVPTRVEHKARVPEWARERQRNMPALYMNTFVCSPSTIPFRMPVRKREPVNANESAVVVGPEGVDILTDQFGRIKIQAGGIATVRMTTTARAGCASCNRGQGRAGAFSIHSKDWDGGRRRVSGRRP